MKTIVAVILSICLLAGTAVYPKTEFKQSIQENTQDITSIDTQETVKQDTKEESEENMQASTDTAQQLTGQASTDTAQQLTGQVSTDTAQQLTEQVSIDVSAPAVLLMEASTGTVIYEKDADTKYHPASVTKIMTLLLIFDALEQGKIHYEDMVTTSEHAASMGGSQVFLESGESQTVDTMIKCIAVASANDACVAIAELICGTEEEFVKQMNARAEGLGMTNTHFENCNGLDKENHMTTARDIALMSKELITKYPKIHEYSTIWMDTIIHTTRKGTSEFGLTNTNKLIRQYEYATGLKTGSTSLAKYCVSATAQKDGVELIAVVLAAPDYKVRFADAVTLFNYGFGVCQIYEESDTDTSQVLKVECGVADQVLVVPKTQFQYVSFHGEDLQQIEKKQVLPESVNAPVKKGDSIGGMEYYLNGEKIGEVPFVFYESIDQADFIDCLMKTIKLCVTM